MPVKRFVRSMNYAIEGILHAASTQTHIRYHLVAAMLLLLACFALGINREEIIILSIVATIVIVAEMINSAIEETVNLVCPRKNEKARVIKDMAAGAVLLTAAVSLVVAYFLIKPYVVFFFRHGISIAKHTGEDIAVCSVLIVLILVIMIKAHTGKGLPLRGGMPSGHASVSFSIWMSFTYVFPSWHISVPLFLAAAAVAASRIMQGIHTRLEVLAGCVLGSGVTFLLYRLFY
ncbi:MAG: diacylglycerol kinase [Spirochaetota bacterium]